MLFRVQRSYYPGMSAFSYESEMLSLVSDYLPALLKPKYSRVFSVAEMYVKDVVPDLLLFSFEEQLLMPNHRKLTTVEAHVLQAIQGVGEAPIQEIADRIILSESRLMRCFDVLEKGGFIKQTSVDKYSVSETVKERHVEIIAVEMKLWNWRMALEQALSYTEFADRAYVILDGFQVDIAEDVVTAYRDCGIGLLLQHGWQLEPIVDAREGSPRSAHRFIAVQKLIQNMIRG